MRAKWIIGLVIILVVSASVCLRAQTDQLESKAGKLYADKGTFELFGDISLGGTTGDSPFFFFSAGPGVNYFVIKNLYIGSQVIASVERLKVNTNPFLFVFKRQVQNILGCRLRREARYAFNISKNVFFNITPEMNFLWYDSGFFRAYPNIILSLKFIINNTSINVGFEQNFFYFTDEGDKSVSDFIYSYNISLGFSFFL